MRQNEYLWRKGLRTTSVCNVSWASGYLSGIYQTKDSADRTTLHSLTEINYCGLLGVYWFFSVKPVLGKKLRDNQSALA